MTNIDQNLEDLGISLPSPPEPVGSYAAAVEENGFLYVSGQLPIQDGTMFYAGRLGADLDLSDGYAAARLAAVNLISRIRKALDGFERLNRIVRIDGYFSVTQEFVELPAVLDGCSDLIAEALGEKGQHARTVYGVYSLPLNAAVELAAVCALSPAENGR